MRAAHVSAQLPKPVKASQLYEALLRMLATAEAPGSTPGRRAEGRRCGSAALRLVVAEGNAVNRRLALALLGKLDYADVVDKGREALDALERQPYDVVLRMCRCRSWTDLRRHAASAPALGPVRRPDDHRDDGECDAGRARGVPRGRDG